MSENSKLEYTKDVKFKEYLRDSMKVEWKDKYFAYSKVKREISEQFQSLLKELNETSENSTNQNKFKNFGNNPKFQNFLQSIQPKIQNDVTRVNFHIKK